MPVAWFCLVLGYVMAFGFTARGFGWGVSQARNLGVSCHAHMGNLRLVLLNNIGLRVMGAVAALYGFAGLPDLGVSLFRFTLNYHYLRCCRLPWLLTSYGGPTNK